MEKKTGGEIDESFLALKCLTVYTVYKGRKKQNASCSVEIFEFRYIVGKNVRF